MLVGGVGVPVAPLLPAPLADPLGLLAASHGFSMARLEAEVEVVEVAEVEVIEAEAPDTGAVEEAAVETEGNIELLLLGLLTSILIGISSLTLTSPESPPPAAVAVPGSSLISVLISILTLTSWSVGSSLISDVSMGSVLMKVLASCFSSVAALEEEDEEVVVVVEGEDDWTVEESEAEVVMELTDCCWSMAVGVTPPAEAELLTISPDLRGVEDMAV